MKAHIEHQVIEKDGVPLFVLVPNDENSVQSAFRKMREGFIYPMNRDRVP